MYVAYIQYGAKTGFCIFKRQICRWKAYTNLVGLLVCWFVGWFNLCLCGRTFCCSVWLIPSLGVCVMRLLQQGLPDLFHLKWRQTKHFWKIKTNTLMHSKLSIFHPYSNCLPFCQLIRLTRCGCIVPKDFSFTPWSFLVETFHFVALNSFHCCGVYIVLFSPFKHNTTQLMKRNTFAKCGVQPCQWIKQYTQHTTHQPALLQMVTKTATTAKTDRPTPHKGMRNEKRKKYRNNGYNLKERGKSLRILIAHKAGRNGVQWIKRQATVTKKGTNESTLAVPSKCELHWIIHGIDEVFGKVRDKQKNAKRRYRWLDSGWP